MSRYTEKVKETESFSKNLSLENDMRTKRFQQKSYLEFFSKHKFFIFFFFSKSFFVFLQSLDKHEEMFAEVIREVYTVVFERGIEKDVGFEIYDRLKERLGKELIEFATKLAFEPAPIELLRSEHKHFQDASFLLEQGLSQLIQKK